MTQQIQLAATAEELKQPDHYQATINKQLQILLPSSSVNLTPVSDIPVAKSDRALLEFINGEDRCTKFINQDLTFLQPSEINHLFRFDERNTNPHQKAQDQRKLVQLPQNTQQYGHANTQVQTVEPTLGITPEQHHRIRNNPDTIPANILETKLVKNYAETNIKTLDSIVIQQPKRFLPLAQEAKRLADEIQKEEIAAQWAGTPAEKLLDTSFVAQLNQLQALEQIAPLQQAKDQLPNDIIEILELLGKSDNVPISQLYILTDSCADRYYTQVITAIVKLFKRHLIDRQTVLVNTARALKYLEEYSQRQSKLWKILSKYDDLPDHFHDLKESITQEFNYLKKAILPNVSTHKKNLIHHSVLI